MEGDTQPVESVLDEIARLKAENAELQAKNDLWGKDCRAMQTAKEATEAENLTLKAVNESLTATVEELSAAATSTPAAKTEVIEDTFTLDDEEYGFAYPAVMIAGNKVTGAHVLASKELQATLVKMQSGFLVKKPKQ